MLCLLHTEKLSPPLYFGVSNDHRSPYRFKITNLSWAEGREPVVLEAFEGEKRLARLLWTKGFPNVYEAKARRQGRSKDILICATCDGNQTQYSAVWLFSGISKRLTLLRDRLDNADDFRLSCGIVMEEGVDRWLFYPPRNDSLDGWYHRTWKFNRKTQRLIPGPWRPGALQR